MIKENRQCGSFRVLISNSYLIEIILELILSAEPFQPSCNQNRSIDDECRKKFGSKTFLCTIGECRCNGAESFADKEKTGCCKKLI